MVDNESQRKTLDIDNLRVFRGGVQPGGVVVAPKAMGR